MQRSLEVIVTPLSSFNKQRLYYYLILFLFFLCNTICVYRNCILFCIFPFPVISTQTHVVGAIYIQWPL